MINKLIIAIAIVACSAALLFTGFLWMTMANASLKLLSNNAEFWRQQLYLTQNQTALDYEDISVSSHFLLPSIIVTKPMIQIVTTEGSYKLTAPEIEFVGSFSKLGEMRAILPNEITFSTDSETMTLPVTAAPDILLRSTQDTATTPPAEITFNELKLENNTPLRLNIPIKTTDKENAAELTFTPPLYLSQRWVQLRYEIYPYLQNFSVKVQSLTGSHAASSRSIP